MIYFQLEVQAKNFFESCLLRFITLSNWLVTNLESQCQKIWILRNTFDIVTKIMGLFFTKKSDIVTIFCSFLKKSSLNFSFDPNDLTIASYWFLKRQVNKYRYSNTIEIVVQNRPHPPNIVQSETRMNIIRRVRSCICPTNRTANISICLRVATGKVTIFFYHLSTITLPREILGIL